MLANLAIILPALAAACRPISLQSSVLAQYSNISPDGLDWIIQGRALAFGFSGDWPVLRNPGYVLVSAGDALAGGNGLVFAAGAVCGLLMQWLGIQGSLAMLHVAPFPRFALLASYFLGPLHFIDLYILADTLAVGFLLLSLYLGSRGLAQSDFRWVSAGLLTSVVGATFQLYAATGLVCITLAAGALWITRVIERRLALRTLVFSAGLTVLFALAKSLWEGTIPHASVPQQLDLIDLSLSMTGFYVNVWVLYFLPLVCLLLLGRVAGPPTFPMTPHNHAGRVLVAVFIPALVALVVLAFFYQWPESRFAYSYAGILTVVLGLLVFSRPTPASSDGGLTVESRVARLLLGLSILVLLLLTPTNPWQPRIDGLQAGAIWLTHGRTAPPSYRWYEDAREALCQGDKVPSQAEVEQILLENLQGDPYRTKVGRFGLLNCL